MMQATLRPLLLAGVAMVVVTACGGGGDPTPVAVALNAEVCTEGDGPRTQLYIRNLDDFEWKDITYTIMKRDAPFTREWPNLLPESQQPAEPFTDGMDFMFNSDVSAGEGQGGGGGGTGVSGPQVLRLRRFIDIDSARIEIGLPQSGTWTGDIHPCR